MAGNSGKSADAFRTISEVSERLDVPQHVLRFWETKFTQVKPLKRAGGRRYYRPEDIELLERLRDLLYAEGYTIRGVQKLLRENGVKALLAEQHAAPETKAEAPPPPPAPAVEADGQAMLFPMQAAAPAPTGLPEAARAALTEVLQELQAIRAAL